MIWKTTHINEDALYAQDFIIKDISSQKDLKFGAADFFNVGIVGGGPKGLYALEELISRIKNEEISDTWQILWFNDTVDFGSGPNYQVQQPEYLLINYCIAHIDAWTRTRWQPEDHINLMDWIRKYQKEGSEVKPTDFASRALVGRYLQDVAAKVISTVSENVHIRLIAENVEDIKLKSNGKLMIKTRYDSFCCNNVLLTTGHCYRNFPLVELNEQTITQNYIASAYPVDVLDKIPPKKKVGIIGWGLTFIDAVLHLTEGRGGVFDSDFNYIASGNEPVLLPFSRNQLPIIPRGAIYGDNVYRLQYLNEDWFSEMQMIKQHRKIDFLKEIFPFIEKELVFAYYSTVLQNRKVEEVESYINSLPDGEIFCYNDLLFPKIPNIGTLQKSYINYLKLLIIEAEKGPLKSPLMAAASVWREAGTMIAELYSAGGFTGESQKYLDSKLFSALCRTSYGPPIENMKKILALMKANIVQVHFDSTVKITHDEATKKFTLEAATRREFVDFIVDARIARPNLIEDNSALYKNLLKNCLIQPYTNQLYQPGCVNIITTGKIAVDNKNIPLYFYGSSTEGFLLDNDSLSRIKNNLGARWASETAEQYLKLTRLSD